MPTGQCCFHITTIDVVGDRNNYLLASARLRGISRHKLIQRTFDAILDDQLFLSILDDEGELKDACIRHEKPPVDHLFDCLVKEHS
jgi:hypothetical protein